MRIEDFLRDLSIISQKYGMIIDANGNQSKNSPLALYTYSGKTPTYRKIGYLNYSFEGDNQQPIFNFDPKENSKLSKTELNPESLKNEINISAELTDVTQQTENHDNCEPRSSMRHPLDMG